jgi:hypothetical protein
VIYVHAAVREDAKNQRDGTPGPLPADHVFKPHWRDSNETFLDAGGYSFLPARELSETMSCASQHPLLFYVSLDGDPKSRCAPVPARK